LLGIEILIKKYLPTYSSIGYPNIAIFYSRFLLTKNKKREWLYRVQTRYRKIVGVWEDIESNFYVNDSPNDDLESEL
jgi:hypothetical protein